MTRVLHFAGIINRHDFIDTVLTHLDRRRFDIFALTAIPPRRVEPYGESEVYAVRCLDRPVVRGNYPALFSALVYEGSDCVSLVIITPDVPE